MAYKNQLLLRDRDGRAWGKINAFIKWKDGTSNVWVPESGQAGFTGSGEIEYIEVAGQKHYQHQRVNNDGVIVIRKR